MRKSEETYVFVLLNRGVRNYLFCISRTKEQELFTEIISCVSKKVELICSSNKKLRDLVNVYIMIFIENKKQKKTEKKQKEKSLPFLPLFVRLLVKVDICFACECNF